MNKKNKILVGCLALLLTLSVGYALFSDTITINGTATAKGNFDIVPTCEPGISSKLGTAASFGLANEGGYENDSCTVTDDTVSYQVDFQYLTARRYFTVKLSNNGSIDAAVNIEEISNSVKNATVKQSCFIDKNTNEETCGEVKNDYLTTVFHMEPAAIEDEQGNIHIDDAEIFVDDSGENIILKPKQSLYVLVYVQSPDAENEAEQELYDMYFVRSNFSSKFIFNQVTN